MQHDGIDPRRPGVGPRRQADTQGDDAVGLALGRAQFGHRERLPEVFSRLGRGLRQEFVGQAQQIRGAALAHRDRGDDGHAECFRKPGHVDGNAAARCDVEHVEHERDRPARAFQLEQEADGQPQVGGIGDAQHEIGQGLAGGTAEHDVAGDFLVRAAAAQRIGAGQVDDGDLTALRRHERPLLALHGDAGIVRDLLPAARERVEQRGLAAVRRAHQGEMHQRGFHVCICPAAFRRR